MRCSEPGHRALVAIVPLAGRVAELGSLDECACRMEVDEAEGHCPSGEAEPMVGCGVNSVNFVNLYQAHGLRTPAGSPVI